MEDDPGVALVADRPSNTASNIPQDANSLIHGGTVNAAGIADIPGRGQNITYIDGHVEWYASCQGRKQDVIIPVHQRETTFM